VVEHESLHGRHVFINYLLSFGSRFGLVCPSLSITTLTITIMASPPHSKLSVSVPKCHVALVLLEDGSSNFYLKIPLDTIRDFCSKPLKYLIYLGWCILGCEGILADEHGEEIAVTGVIYDQAIYRYIPEPELGTFLSQRDCCHARTWTLTTSYVPLNEDPVRAVDLEVIRARTSVQSETSHSRDGFKPKLLARDICCPWTGTRSELGDAIHIVPFRRGPEVRPSNLR
jgi:hypothetical protein